MRASHFKVVGGRMPAGLRLIYRPFPASAPQSFDLDLEPDGYRLTKAFGSKPASWAKTCAAIAAAIRDGYIPTNRTPT
jgi:hypothetical protein